MKRMEVTNGFTIKVVEEPTLAIEVTHKIGDTEYSGILYGKKNLQLIRKEIIDLLQRRPLDTDGVKMRALGDYIEKEVPGMAFVLLISTFDEGESLANYISNGEREDCIKWMRETADRIEKGTSFATPENN